MPAVAVTVADAVRLAVFDGDDRYWRNCIKDGPLLDAMVRNTITTARYREIADDNMKMALCEKHGRRHQRGVA